MTEDDTALRRGWTTGACAAAAAKAACQALLTGAFPDPVSIVLPGGQTPAFALAREMLSQDEALAGIVKDAGDDPDVTHGAIVFARVRKSAGGAGLIFRAGAGVGTVTRPGLPLPVGEPAINPAPRKMIAVAIADVAGEDCDFEVEIGVEDGERLALKTLNGRLGIVGGLSILGTTGIVIPYSCAAWIDSIHRGVDVARAMGIAHIAGSTGSASEQAIKALHRLPDVALIEMGDFIGGLLKYVRAHPVPRVSIAGGLAKITKLAQGMLDVHSKRGGADLADLAALARQAGAPEVAAAAIANSNTVAEAFMRAHQAGVELGDCVAARAWDVAAAVMNDPAIEIEIVIFDRDGGLAGRAAFRGSHEAGRPLNLR